MTEREMPASTYFEHAPLAKRMFKKLGLLDDKEKLSRTFIVFVRGKLKKQGMLGKVEKVGDKWKAFIETEQDSPEKIERTIIHELYHIFAESGGEVGARTMEIMWLLKRLSKTGNSAMLKGAKTLFYNWFFTDLVKYRTQHVQPWEHLAVKQGLRKFGKDAYKIYKGKDAEALAYILRYTAPTTIFFTIYSSPDMLKNIHRVSYLSEREKKLLAKKLLDVARIFGTYIHLGLRDEEMYRGIANLIVAKQLLEGRKKLDENEVVECCVRLNARNIDEKARKEIEAQLRKHFRMRALELALEDTEMLRHGIEVIFGRKD